MTMAAASTFLWAYGSIIVSWTIRLWALIAIPVKRPASEARAWLLVFFILPVPALLLYWMIGRPEHSKNRKIRFGQIPSLIHNAALESGILADELGGKLKRDWEPTAALAGNLGQLPVLKGNAVQLISEYDEFNRSLIDDINSASKHVHLMFYIFANDRTGDKVMSALEAAQARGVTCRVLFDSLGSFKHAKAVQTRLEEANIAVQQALPLRRRWTSSRLDLRNHRKIAVFDGKVAYTGSQNIVDSRVSKRMTNFEIMARVKGPAVSEFQSVFLADWFMETGRDASNTHPFSLAEPEGPSCAQVLPTGPDFVHGSIDLFFTQLFYHARRQVVVTTPYFIPNDSMIAAMKAAALRGVHVTLILSQKSDNLVVNLAQRSYYSELLESGIEILLFRPGFLHAKHIRMDDEISVIGSSNLDLRSFELNAEISLICYGKKVARDFRPIEEYYRQNSEALSQDQWTGRSWTIKATENIARLLSDLI